MYTREVINHFTNILKLDQEIVLKYLENIYRSYAIYSELVRNVSLIIPTEENVKVIKKILEPNSLVFIGKNEKLLKRICEENGVDYKVVDYDNGLTITSDVNSYENIFLFSRLVLDKSILEDLLLYLIDNKHFKSLTLLTSLDKNEIEELSKELDLELELIDLKNWRDDTLTVKFKKKG